MEKTLQAEEGYLLAQKLFKEQELSWYNGDVSVDGVVHKGIWQLTAEQIKYGGEHFDAMAEYYFMLAKETPIWKREEQRIQAIMAQMQSAGVAVSIAKFVIGLVLIGGGATLTVGSAGTASPAGLPMIGAGAGMLLSSGK